MGFTTALSVKTILVDGASCQRDDEFSLTLLFVDLVAIAMTTEIMAGGIHRSQAVHDGHDDEEKGGEPHC